MSIDKELKDALNTEVHTTKLGDLTVQPCMQMRDVMNREVVTQYAENVDSLPPVIVFEVISERFDGVHDVDWYLVDGFHRYFAHEEAGRDTINIVLHKNATYDDAFDFAMTSNYKNGQQPSKGDRKRSVEMMCEHYAEEFGLDSKQVVKFLMGRGVPRQTAEEYTKLLRVKLDTKRDRKIAELLEEGMSQRKIAKEVGCSADTVNRIKKVIDASVRNPCNRKIVHPESPPAPSDDPTDTIDLDDLDDDEDQPSTVEQQAAFQQAHEEHEQNRRKRASNGSSRPDKPSRLELLKMLVDESRGAKPYDVLEMEELTKIINAVGF